MIPLQEFWHYFRRNRGTAVGLAYVVVMILIVVSANVFALYNPADQFRDMLLAPLTRQEGDTVTHLFGTGGVGRDMLSYLTYGVRLSLLVGCLVVVLFLPMGVVPGPIAGYFGRVVDNVIMRAVDIILALPSLLLVLVLVAMFGPPTSNIALALTLVALPRYVRLTRAAALVEVNHGCVAASHVTGVGVVHQTFANTPLDCLAPLIVQASLGFSNAILDMVTLDFPGTGAQLSVPKWGTMFSNVLQFAQSARWTVTFPGLVVLPAALTFNLMGDGLCDALDPKLKQ